MSFIYGGHLLSFGAPEDQFNNMPDVAECFNNCFIHL